MTTPTDGSTSSPGQVPLLGFAFPSRQSVCQRTIWVVLFAALLILPGLGVREVITSDEGQRTYPPLEMLRTGDWVVPRINGEEYLKKPPLLYWQVAVFYRVFGENVRSARLPCALAGIALVALVYLWARKFSHESTALLAAAITAANFLVLAKSRNCQLDIPMTLFTFAALWQWWRALQCLRTGEQGLGRAAFRAGLWLSLAHLYKFPVPFLFVLAAWGGTSAALRRWRWLLKGPLWASLVGSLIPVAIWGIVTAQAVGWNRALTIWIREGALHVQQATDINSGPAWYYLTRLIAVLAPWCLLFPVLFLPAFHQAQASRRLTFHFLWTGSVISLVFLSINTAKETEYMLGAMPLLCVLLAWAWEFWVTDLRGAKWSAAARKWALGASLTLYFLAGWVGIPAWEMYMSQRRSVRELALVARSACDTGYPVAAYDVGGRPQLHFYLNRRIPVLETTRQAASFLLYKPDGLLIVSGRKRKFVEDIVPVRTVASGGPSADLSLVAGAEAGDVSTRDLKDSSSIAE